MKGSESTYSAGIISLTDLCMLICLKEFKSVNRCQRGSCLATNSPHSSGSPTRWWQTRYRRQTAESDTAPYLDRHRRLGPKTERWSHSLQHRERRITTRQNNRRSQSMSFTGWSGVSHQPAINWLMKSNKQWEKKKNCMHFSGHAFWRLIQVEIVISAQCSNQKLGRDSLHCAVPKNGGSNLNLNTLEGIVYIMTFLLWCLMCKWIVLWSQMFSMNYFTKLIWIVCL